MKGKNDPLRRRTPLEVFLDANGIKTPHLAIAADMFPAQLNRYIHGKDQPGARLIKRIVFGGAQTAAW